MILDLRKNVKCYGRHIQKKRKKRSKIKDKIKLKIN